ncbi:cytidine deaminase-like protein [Biscogniauxia sp. FL1348]|nr:cytidine deaminase-like protein [Biscogniauxia sp. FL1348]
METPEPPTTTTTTTTTHTPAALLRALLTTIEKHVVPLTALGVSSGSKVFGAAILSGADLAPLTAATNDERQSPLLHGEVNCIQQFFAQGHFPAPELSPPSPSPSPPVASKEEAIETETENETKEEEIPYPLGPGRPSPRSCVFLATHEPCSLCLSALAWAGFATVYYLFAHADSRDLFAIPYDIEILEAVFRVDRHPPSPHPGTEEKGPTPTPSPLPLYNRTNKFFTARSLAELAAQVPDPQERRAWEAEIARVRALYDELSESYQKGKREGVGSASFWK